MWQVLDMPIRQVVSGTESPSALASLQRVVVWDTRRSFQVNFVGKSMRCECIQENYQSVTWTAWRILEIFYNYILELCETLFRECIKDFNLRKLRRRMIVKLWVLVNWKVGELTSKLPTVSFCRNKWIMSTKWYILFWRNKTTINQTFALRWHLLSIVTSDESRIFHYTGYQLQSMGPRWNLWKMILEPNDEILSKRFCHRSLRKNFSFSWASSQGFSFTVSSIRFFRI